MGKGNFSVVSEKSHPVTFPWNVESSSPVILHCSLFRYNVNNSDHIHSNSLLKLLGVKTSDTRSVMQ
jgi:hypothetical protein